ncbi:Uncharacterised protein [Campylobacter hyointestinalis subsp. hyointestinalis]|uniref:Uncharacterized protein n=1 Tax=Campylobacter hyointestinalis subsp. hyointestinalis TaxID=91352 RepID=A0A9W5ASG9_CAMHY|nr:hypothetical protein [Campylobacter hyointestinalis]CUU81790.1 Uncharacterised protein [Campylobacter hyointestinalis subsp. hyointestinalis]
MKVYYIDDDGNLTGQGESYTCPNGATEIAPPNEPNMHYRFIDGSWVGTPIEIHLFKVSKITLRQTKLILNQIGLLSWVEAYINSIEDEQLRATAKIEWEYANDVERTNPLIATLQTGLNLSDEQVDTMFEQASKL